MVGTKATALPSVRRRRDQARIAALSRITSGSCAAAAAMGAKWNRTAMTQEKQAKFVDKKWEWDAAADKKNLLRKWNRDRPFLPSGREKKDFSSFLLPFKNSAARVDSFWT